MALGDGTGTLVEQRRRDGQVPRRFGRQAETARLRSAWAATRAGRGGVLLVVGEAGIGKSVLLDDLAGEARTVRRATGDPDEVHVDLGLYGQLLDEPGMPAAADPLAAGARLTTRLAAVLETAGPALLLVDDAQWADDASLRALNFATRRLCARPLLTVVALRPDGLEQLPEGLVRTSERTEGHLEILPLEPAAVAELAADVAGRPLPPRAVARLHGHTGGNPLHLIELLRELPSDVLDSDLPLPAPASFAVLVRRRLEALPAAAQRLAAAASLLGQEVRATDAAAVAGTDGLLETLDALVSADLVVLRTVGTDRRLRFTHELVRAAVQDTLTETQRASLHGRAARVLEGLDALGHELRAASTPDPGLVGRVREAARELVAAGAWVHAATLLRDVAPFATSTRDRQVLGLEAAVHLLEAGRPLGPLHGVALEARDQPLAAHVLGRLALSEGDVATAERYLERAWAGREESGASPTAATTAALLGVVAQHRRRFDLAATWARRSLTAGPGAAIGATMLAIAVALDAGTDTALGELDRLVATSAGPARADALSGRGMVRLWAGDLEGSRTDLEDACRLLERANAIVATANARAALAEVLLRRGELERAHRAAANAAQLVEDSEQVWLEPLSHGILATVAAVLGADDAAGRHAERAARTAAAVGLFAARHYGEHAPLAAAEVAGDHAEVVARCEAIVADGRDQLPEGIKPWRAAYVTALCALGRAHEARPIVAELATASATRPDDAVLACAGARAGAALEVALGRPTNAAAILSAALERAPDPTLERTRARLALGEALRRAGQRRAAAEALNAARDELAQMGARPWVIRAERELAACGLRPARRRYPATDALTPQERTIAHLVSRGATNREVATTLVLSVKTVEHHLTRIYGKLGVRSRTELAACAASVLGVPNDGEA